MGNERSVIELMARTFQVQRHPKRVVFEKVQFDSDTEWVVIEEAITMVGDETAVNIQTNVKKSVPDNALINIQVSRETKIKDEFGLFLKSGDVPVCGLLKNATEAQPMFKTMIVRLLEFTNMPYQCPLPVVSMTYITSIVIELSFTDSSSVEH